MPSAPLLFCLSVVIVILSAEGRIVKGEPHRTAKRPANGGARRFLLRYSRLKLEILHVGVIVIFRRTAPEGLFLRHRRLRAGADAHQLIPIRDDAAHRRGNGQRGRATFIGLASLT